MFKCVIRFSEEHEIDMKNCRGQTYDNTLALSGKFNGLQAKIATVNNLTLWICCTGHSLISTCWVLFNNKKCGAIDLFDFLEKNLRFLHSFVELLPTDSSCKINQIWFTFLMYNLHSKKNNNDIDRVMLIQWKFSLVDTRKSKIHDDC